MKCPNHYNQLSSILHLSPPSTKKIAKQITRSMLYQLHKSPAELPCTARLRWRHWKQVGVSRTCKRLRGYKSVLCSWKKSKQKWQKRQVLAPSPSLRSSYVIVYTLTGTPKRRYLWYPGQLLSIKVRWPTEDKAEISLEIWYKLLFLYNTIKKTLKYPQQMGKSSN